MIKENLFLKSAKRDMLLEEAMAMVPSIDVIINELWNTVYKDDIENVIACYFNKQDDIEIYIYQNYFNTLSLLIVVSNLDNKLFELDVDSVLERYGHIHLFSEILEPHCEVIENVGELTGINGKIIRVR